MSFILTSISLIISLQFGSIPQQTQEKGFTLEDLPEYVVIRGEAVKTGKNRTLIMAIDHKRTKYETSLKALEDYLSNKRKLAVRSQSELLTGMSEIGYDYVDAYRVGTTSDLTNVVFRKKEKFRE